MICQTVPLNFFRLGLAQLAMAKNVDAHLAGQGEAAYWVEWPLGWELTEVGESPVATGPRRVRATSQESRKDSAAIELSFAPRFEGDSTTPADALGDSVDYLRELMAARGFEVEVEPGAVTALGGLPAVEARVEGVSPAGRMVRQWNIVAFGDSQAYSLSFTGTAESYQRHLAAFTRVRASLLLA